MTAPPTMDCPRCASPTLSEVGHPEIFFCYRCQQPYRLENGELVKEKGGTPEKQAQGQETVSAAVSYTFALPYPLSVNHSYATVNGRRVKSAASRTYTLEAGMIARVRVAEPLVGRLSVSILYHPKRGNGCDLDNLCKVVLDSLTGVCWKDDRQIDLLTVERGEVQKGGALWLTVETMETK